MPSFIILGALHTPSIFTQQDVCMAAFSVHGDERAQHFQVVASARVRPQPHSWLCFTPVFCKAPTTCSSVCEPLLVHSVFTHSARAPLCHLWEPGVTGIPLTSQEANLMGYKLTGKVTGL